MGEAVIPMSRDIDEIDNRVFILQCIRSRNFEIIKQLPQLKHLFRMLYMLEYCRKIITDKVKSLFQIGHMLRELNMTYIILNSGNGISQTGQSLNVSYKIISILMENKLKRVLKNIIYQLQGAFL